MRARIIVPRQRLAAIFSAVLYFLVGGAAALLIDDDEQSFRRLLRWSALLVFAAIVPWVLLRWRGGVHEVKATTRGAVSVGRHTFNRAHVGGFSVAPDGRGVSVAFGEGDHATFLELDRLDDARALARHLGLQFPREGVVRTTLSRLSLVYVMGLFSFLEVFFAFYLPLVTRIQPGYHEGTVVGGLGLGLLTVALVVVRGREPMNLAWGSEEAAATRAFDRSPEERHVRRHVMSALSAEPAPARVLVEALQRGDDEATRAWLARLDAFAVGDPYRGDAFSEDVLRQLYENDTTSIDVRLAAARMLGRRGGDAAVLQLLADDEEVRLRVAAVLDDEADVAAERLDGVGPIFRTR